MPNLKPYQIISLRGQYLVKLKLQKLSLSWANSRAQ